MKFLEPIDGLRALEEALAVTKSDQFRLSPKLMTVYLMKNYYVITSGIDESLGPWTGPRELTEEELGRAGKRRISSTTFLDKGVRIVLDKTLEASSFVEDPVTPPGAGPT